MRLCQRCGVELTPQNWYVCHQKIGAFVCKVCTKTPKTYQSEITQIQSIPKNFMIWLAGFVDGDGCITLEKVGTTRATPRYTPKLNIVNTNRNVIQYIQRTLKCGCVSTNRPRSINHKTVWSYDLVGCIRVRTVLEIIEPYLRVKNEQCALIIKWTTRHQSRRTPYDDEDNEMIERIRFLNRRGNGV